MTHKETHDAIQSAQRRSLVVLAAFAVALVAKIAVVRIVVLGQAAGAGLAIDALFVLSVLALADLLFPDMRFRALMLTDLLLTTSLAALVVFDAYYGRMPTRESLLGAQQAASLGDSILTLASPWLLFMFADIAVAAWWGARCARRGIDPSTGAPAGAGVAPDARTPYVYQRRLVYVVAVACAIAAALAVRDVRQISGPIDGAGLARRYGVFTIATAELMGRKAAPIRAQASDAEALQMTIDGLRGGVSSGPIAGFEPGSARGAHVIVVQLEAFESAVVGAEVGGREVTPNLNALARESWYFPNTISQIGLGTTADAEFTVNSSLYGPTDGAASLMYADKQVPSLPRVLKAEGYRSATFHTNSVEYWNRSQLYPALGFDRYYDRAFFGDQDKVAFGASDRVLYRKSLPELVRMDAAGTPFYAQIVSMSSHYPYIALPEAQRDFVVDGVYRKTIVGDYLVHASYADAALGEFIAELKRTGLWDKSVVVVYGDHFGLQEPTSEAEAAAMRALLRGRDRTPVDALSVPLVVHLPGQTQGRRVSTPAAHADIAPSIADALGLEQALRPHFGRSVFAQGPVLVPAGGLLPPGSFVDDQVLWVPGLRPEDAKAWSLAARVPTDTPAASRGKWENTLEMLGLSETYVNGLPVRTDYDPEAEKVLPDR